MGANFKVRNKKLVDYEILGFGPNTSEPGPDDMLKEAAQVSLFARLIAAVQLFFVAYSGYCTRMGIRFPGDTTLMGFGMFY